MHIVWSFIFLVLAFFVAILVLKVFSWAFWTLLPIAGAVLVVLIVLGLFGIGPLSSFLKDYIK